MKNAVDIVEIARQLDLGKNAFKRWCAKKVSARRDKKIANTICFLLCDYVVERYSLVKEPVEKIVEGKELHMVNFFDNTHVFFIQNNHVLHSFRGRHPPKLEKWEKCKKVKKLQSALAGSDIGELAKLFKLLPLIVHESDGQRLYSNAAQINKNFSAADKLQKLQIFICR